MDCSFREKLIKFSSQSFLLSRTQHFLLNGKIEKIFISIVSLLTTHLLRITEIDFIRLHCWKCPILCSVHWKNRKSNAEKMPKYPNSCYKLKRTKCSIVFNSILTANCKHRETRKLFFARIIIIDRHKRKLNICNV